MKIADIFVFTFTSINDQPFNVQRHVQLHTSDKEFGDHGRDFLFI